MNSIKLKLIFAYKKTILIIAISIIILSLLISAWFVFDSFGTKIIAVDDCGFHDKMFDKANELTVTVGEIQYYIKYEEDINQILDKLKEIRVQKKAVSKDRSEDRDNTNSIIFENYTLHFNDKFDEVWCYDNVKPSFSYKIKNKSTVRDAFDLIANSESNRVNSSLVVQNIKTGSNQNGLVVSVKNISIDLKEPYIDLEIKNESEKTYSFGLKTDLYYNENDEYISCSTFKSNENRKRTVSAVALIMKPGAEEIITKQFSFVDDDLSKAGKYKFETEYCWVEFELKK